MSFCENCIKGVRHEGTPTGKIQEINGVKTYVALPKEDYPKNKAVLFLSDIFGLGLPNAQLLADDYALNGFQVYIPDYLHGDPVPDSFLNGQFDLNTWFPRHTQAITRPTLDKVIAGLKERGITEFGAIGFCFGARYTFDLAFDGVIKAGVVAHPSMLTDEDFEKYAKTNVPLLINSCEFDDMFPPATQAKADEVLGDGKFAPGYLRTHWEGCSHGFAVRGDVSNPKVKAGREGVFKATVEWLIKYL